MERGKVKRLLWSQDLSRRRFHLKQGSLSPQRTEEPPKRKTTRTLPWCLDLPGSPWSIPLMAVLDKYCLMSQVLVIEEAVYRVNYQNPLKFIKDCFCFFMFILKLENDKSNFSLYPMFFQPHSKACLQIPSPRFGGMRESKAKKTANQKQDKITWFIEISS